MRVCMYVFLWSLYKGYVVEKLILDKLTEIEPITTPAGNNERLASNSIGWPLRIGALYSKTHRAIHIPCITRIPSCSNEFPIYWTFNQRYYSCRIINDSPHMYAHTYTCLAWLLTASLYQLVLPSVHVIVLWKAKFDRLLKCLVITYVS